MQAPLPKKTLRRKRMTVERSYSSYEAIRTYHDKGMMKWGAFATNDLTDAQNLFADEDKKDKVTTPLSPHQIINLISQSYINQVQLKLKYQSKQDIKELYGFISDLKDNQIRFKSSNKIFLIPIENIVNLSQI